jgi:antitoxin YefM
MSHVSYTDFRKELASYMDAVCDSRAPLTVTRRGGRSVVVLAEEEYEGLMETLHLLRSPANAARLREAIATLDAGKGVEHEIEE